MLKTNLSTLFYDSMGPRQENIVLLSVDCIIYASVKCGLLSLFILMKEYNLVVQPAYGKTKRLTLIDLTKSFYFQVLCNLLSSISFMRFHKWLRDRVLCSTWFGKTKN